MVLVEPYCDMVVRRWAFVVDSIHTVQKEVAWDSGLQASRHSSASHLLMGLRNKTGLWLPFI